MHSSRLTNAAAPSGSPSQVLRSPSARKASTAYKPTMASWKPKRTSSNQLSARLWLATPSALGFTLVSSAVSFISIPVSMYCAMASTAGIHPCTAARSPVFIAW